MTKIFKLLTSRLLLSITFIIIQLIVILTFLNYLNDNLTFMYFIFQLISGLMLIQLFSDYRSPSVKLPWVVVIIIFPITGIFFYFMIHDNKMRRNYVLHMANITEHIESYKKQEPDIMSSLQSQDPLLASKANYVLQNNDYPVHNNTTYEYFDVGEAMFTKMLDDLNASKHFIFMEYFIIKSGYMWDEISSILIERAQAGVDVRLIYDDIGCLGMIPYDTYKSLEQKGVKVERFNPFVPILSMKHNTRDHRKICVVDGYIAYTGGLNLADEYINHVVHFGHWKDTAMRFVGEGVLQFTTMFLENWTFLRKEDFSISEYLPHTHHSEPFETDGYVQMYGDGPLNNHLVGQTIYMNILNQAKDYVYIYTPYLIVDNELIVSICMAAQRGVDVRIILPHIPDKWYVHTESQSYYPRLLNAGVTIIEYTPGFMHAKCFISDDEIAVIGTSNLDYRSLYHHFECGAIIYKATILEDVKADFIRTMSNSQVFTHSDYKKTALIKRLLGTLIKFFSPLM